MSIADRVVERIAPGRFVTLDEVGVLLGAAGINLREVVARAEESKDALSETAQRLYAHSAATRQEAHVAYAEGLARLTAERDQHLAAADRSTEEAASAQSSSTAIANALRRLNGLNGNR